MDDGCNAPFFHAVINRFGEILKNIYDNIMLFVVSHASSWPIPLYMCHLIN